MGLVARAGLGSLPHLKTGGGLLKTPHLAPPNPHPAPRPPWRQAVTGCLERRAPLGGAGTERSPAARGCVRARSASPGLFVSEPERACVCGVCLCVRVCVCVRV